MKTHSLLAVLVLIAAHSLFADTPNEQGDLKLPLTLSWHVPLERGTTTQNDDLRDDLALYGLRPTLVVSYLGYSYIRDDGSELHDEEAQQSVLRTIQKIAADNKEIVDVLLLIAGDRGPWNIDIKAFKKSHNIEENTLSIAYWRSSNLSLLDECQDAEHAFEQSFLTPSRDTKSEPPYSLKWAWMPKLGEIHRIGIAMDDPWLIDIGKKADQPEVDSKNPSHNNTKRRPVTGKGAAGDKPGDEGSDATEPRSDPSGSVRAIRLDEIREALIKWNLGKAYGLIDAYRKRPGADAEMANACADAITALEQAYRERFSLPHSTAGRHVEAVEELERLEKTYLHGSARAKELAEEIDTLKKTAEYKEAAKAAKACRDAVAKLEKIALAENCRCFVGPIYCSYMRPEEAKRLLGRVKPCVAEFASCRNTYNDSPYLVSIDRAEAFVKTLEVASQQTR